MSNTTFIPAVQANVTLAFTLDGSSSPVIQDTVTPANNRPMPVLLLNSSGPMGTLANPIVTTATLAGLPATLGQKTMAGSLAVVIASDQSSIPVTVGSIALPTGASTSALQTSGNASLTSIDGKIPAQGQALMAASSPIVIASDQSAVPVSGTVTANIGTSGSLALNATLTNNSQTSQIVDSSGTSVTVKDLATQIAAGDKGLVVNSAIHAITTGGGGGYVDVKANPSGALTVDASGSSVSVSNFPATQPISGTVTANAGTGTFTVDGSGVTQPISAAALPLPTGAATAANQPALGTAGSASADVISVQGVASMTALIVDGSAVTQPISGTVTVAQATAGNLNATVTGSVSVSNFPGTQPVSGTVTANAGTGTFVVDGSGVTQPISAAALPLPAGAATSANQPTLGTAGTAASDVITVQGIASMTALKVDGSAVTQPVSAAALPLPTGASTEAKQPALGVAGTPSSDVITVQGDASMTALKVDGSATTQPVSGTVTANAGTGSFTVAQATAASLNASVVQSGTWNINNVSGTVSLPTGAATDATLTTLSNKFGSIGQHAMAGSTSVVIASDQSSIPTTPGVAAAVTQTFGKIAFGSLTGSFATIMTLSSDAKIVAIFSSLDQPVTVSLDGGTTSFMELDSESVVLDLGTSGMKINSGAQIQVKYSSSAPTVGSIRVSVLG